jgi:cell volume regulation protein A
VRPAVALASTARSGLRLAERRLVAWGGLKGAVPLLLAAYPALDALEGAERVAGIVLVATAASVVLQGATLGRVARGARAEARTPARELPTSRPA